MNISGPFIRRPIGTSLLATGVLVIGALCYTLLGISSLPQMAFPASWVAAGEPGASATTMAAVCTCCARASAIVGPNCD